MKRFIKGYEGKEIQVSSRQIQGLKKIIKLAQKLEEVQERYLYPEENGNELRDFLIDFHTEDNSIIHFMDNLEHNTEEILKEVRKGVAKNDD